MKMPYLLVLLLAGSPVAGFDFVADDGSGNFNTGPSFNDTDFIWGNFFTTDEPMVIVEVSVAFGRVAQGRPVELLVYDDLDNDGTPTALSLVGQASGLTGLSNANAAGPDVFTSYSMSDDAIVSGSFFVAAFISGIDGLSPLSDAPARRDGGTIGNGYIFFGPEGETDLNNLEALPASLAIGDPSVFGGLAGNNLVRAVGTPLPEPTLAGTALLVGGLLVRRRR